MEIKKSTWNGFECIELKFEERDAILVFPKENKCDKWLLKTLYWGEFPSFEIDMLNRGWHLAFIKNDSRWGLDEDLHRSARFVDFISKEFGLYSKCVPVGMSCGGLMAVKFGALHPECVSCMFIDAPVLNLLSAPIGVGLSQAPQDDYEECLQDLNMTLSELINYREHPIDKVPLMVENNVPVIMVYGDADIIVPYTENGVYLEKLYNEAGATLETVCVEGRGHHPHCLEDNTLIIDFVLNHCE